MREAFTLTIQALRAILFVVAHIVIFLGDNLSPPRRGSQDDDEEFSSDMTGTIGRTASGTFEPSTTSARGESVGLFSGSRMK